MDKVNSSDGTAIAFERLGDGPPVVLMGAGREMYSLLAEKLAERFTVFNYDRRGRGESGDTEPYAVEREIEDLGAVIEEAGGSAHVYGHSPGVALALRAAAYGLPIDRLVLHEPPYWSGDEETMRASREFVETIRKLLAEGRRGDAIAHVFSASGTGMPQEMLDDLMPVPAEELSRDEGILAIAHTFAYDFEVVGGDGAVPTGMAGAVPAPALVLSEGWNYPAEIDAGERLAGAMPGGRHVVLEAPHQDGDPEVAGQYYEDPEVLASVVADFFAGEDDGPGYAGR